MRTELWALIAIQLVIGCGICLNSPSFYPAAAVFALFSIFAAIGAAAKYLKG